MNAEGFNWTFFWWVVLVGGVVVVALAVVGIRWMLNVIGNMKG